MRNAVVACRIAGFPKRWTVWQLSFMSTDLTPDENSLTFWVAKPKQGVYLSLSSFHKFPGAQIFIYTRLLIIISSGKYIDDGATVETASVVCAVPIQNSTTAVVTTWSEPRMAKWGRRTYNNLRPSARASSGEFPWRDSRLIKGSKHIQLNNHEL